MPKVLITHHYGSVWTTQAHLPMLCLVLVHTSFLNLLLIAYLLASLHSWLIPQWWLDCIVGHANVGSMDYIEVLCCWWRGVLCPLHNIASHIYCIYTGNRNNGSILHSVLFTVSSFAAIHAHLMILYNTVNFSVIWYRFL